jgi:hypothetical protein
MLRKMVVEPKEPPRVEVGQCPMAYRAIFLGGGMPKVILTVIVIVKRKWAVWLVTLLICDWNIRV